jgi:hypothetical protein
MASRPGELRHLEVTEIDTSPDVLATVKMIYPNATLIDLGNGAVQISFVGATASALACTGGAGSVDISAASCPVAAGLVLTTTSATTAEWLAPGAAAASGINHYIAGLMGA